MAHRRNERDEDFPELIEAQPAVAEAEASGQASDRGATTSSQSNMDTEVPVVAPAASQSGANNQQQPVVLVAPPEHRYPGQAVLNFKPRDKPPARDGFRRIWVKYGQKKLAGEMAAPSAPPRRRTPCCALPCCALPPPRRLHAPSRRFLASPRCTVSYALHGPSSHPSTVVFTHPN